MTYEKMTTRELLEESLKQLKIIQLDNLRREPNHPRNKFKYTIGCADAPDDLYTNSLKKAKLLLQLRQVQKCLGKNILKKACLFQLRTLVKVLLIKKSMIILV